MTATKFCGNSRSRTAAVLVLSLATFFVRSCSDTTEEGQAVSRPAEPVLLEAVSGDNQHGPAGSVLPLPVVVKALTSGGEPAAGIPVLFDVAAGGGSVTPHSALTDSSGIASTRWRLGPAPVSNRVVAAVQGQDARVTFSASADPGDPPSLEFLYGGPQGNASEDIAFSARKGVFLGSPGAILWAQAPDSPFVAIPLSGEQVESPVGIAFGPSGDLYVSDNSGPEGGAVKRISADGRCTTLSSGTETERFALPNDIAVDASGYVYVAATCSNTIFRIDPESGSTRAFLAFPGPNGLAFSADYSFLYFTTENPALFCRGVDKPGGLYRVPVLPDGSAGQVQSLAEGLAAAGDGLAFDEEGNLYVVLSGLLGSGTKGLRKSGVFVYTPDGRLNEFFSVQMPGNIVTNVAFGQEPFDPYSLYVYGFTGRLYRVAVGIKGRPLP